MTFKRRKYRWKNKFKRSKCAFVIGVGTETGTTKKFAIQLQQTLQNQGLKVYVTDLNNCKKFKSLKELIVLTSTYGDGEAPANATRFIDLIMSENRPINYSVVGFGSLAYPDFCRFAFDVDKVLSEKGNMNKRCDIHTIHNQSDQSFQNWYNTWSKEIGISHPLEGIGEKQKATKTKTFIIDKITKPSIDTDQSFVIELKPPNGIRVQSGDLLAVSPSLMDNERLYSIAVLQNGNLLLSVKKHEFGVCSTYLSSLDEGGQIEAFIKSNPAFHLPKNNKSVIMIANGTGIAPFLGMIESNQNALRQMHLFWGGRTMSAWELYSEKINKAMYNNALETFDTAFSRELTPREYVQDIVGLSSEKIVKVLENKGVILICGSISMQKGVISVLDNICNEHTSHSIHFYQNKGQIKMDCY